MSRVAVVTGGSRGVGAGVATVLAQADWRVFTTSRRGVGPAGTTPLVSAELGAAYGIANNDGAQPDSHRSAFHGGPIFPPENEKDV